jgi:hypothetical protein
MQIALVIRNRKSLIHKTKLDAFDIIAITRTKRSSGISLSLDLARVLRQGANGRAADKGRVLFTFSPDTAALWLEHRFTSETMLPRKTYT